VNRPWLPVFAVLLVLPFGGKAHRETERGNRLYADGELDAALQAYTEAGVAAPDAPEVQYNIGNVLYRTGELPGAAEQFARAEAAAPPELRPRASYNLGNALYRERDFRGAVDAYRRALAADPGDADAKRNLELALRALEAQRQPSEGGESKEGDEPNADAPRQGEPQPESSEKSPPPEDRSKAERPEPSPGEARQMTPEEARRLLDRLDEEEKEGLRRELRDAFTGKETEREKDW